MAKDGDLTQFLPFLAVSFVRRCLSHIFSQNLVHIGGENVAQASSYIVLKSKVVPVKRG